MRHPVEWHTARPLWDLALEDGAAGNRFKEPALLRFSSDTFMDDLLRLLGADPARLADHVARRESWEGERVGWVDAAGLAGEAPPRLFQPVHGRFYLVAASLVCRVTGLPDRAVDPAKEKVSFVIRRIEPRPAGGAEPSTWREHAWIGDRKEGTWAPLEDPALPLAGEERLPLFSLAFANEGRQHRLHAGLIPAGGREVYEAGISPPAAPSEPAGPPAPAPVADGEGPTLYVVRCVHERPGCAPFHDPVVSRPSRPFSLASYFDPDAPVRPLRIRMPVDTSFQGLSRFPKGLSILLSSKLRQQAAQAQSAGLKNLADGNAGPAGTAFDLGMICSFSIPIITICALILLMIIVQLLNVVFFWLPLFRICLPIPVKAEGGS